LKFKGLLLTVIIIISSLTFILTQETSREATVDTNGFYFGVSFGGQTVQQAKTLIDKTRSHTNLFVIDSYDLSTNETALNEVCDYAAQSGLNFIVYFDFVSRVAYPWHQTWLDTAKDRWSDRFLGVYLRDELGGKQIDLQEPIKDAANYSDAANRFVNNITYSNSMIDAKNKNIKTFTADYALYWWIYKAGYDTIFAELGWEMNPVQQIALCRGAANMQGKDWGAIIVWKSYEPPYLGSAQEIYDEMVLAYSGGAKYVVVFNYPTYPESNPYGILSEKHFGALEQFWNYVNAYPREDSGGAEAALVLPEDYGWGMRRNKYIGVDNIWGLWQEDEKSPVIWENIDKLLGKYGLRLDIIFSEDAFSFGGKYDKVFFWNSTLTTCS
jgi:hypothetical protein